MPGAAAVLDIGKTNAKLIAFSRDGKILEQLRHPQQAVTENGLRVLDVEGIFRWLESTLAELRRRHDLAGLIVSTHGCACALHRRRQRACRADPRLRARDSGRSERGIRARCAALCRDLFARPAGRAQCRPRDLLPGMGRPDAREPHAPHPHLPAILDLAPLGRARLRGQLPRLSYPLVESARGAIQLARRQARLGGEIPAVCARRRAGRRTRWARRPQRRPRQQRRLLLLQEPRLLQFHPDLDRHLGDHPQSRLSARSARPRARHARQRDRRRRAGRHHPLHGRTRI